MKIKNLSIWIIFLLVVGAILGFSTWNEWNENQKTVIERIRPIRPMAEFNHGSMIDDIAFSPSDVDVIASVGDDNNIKIWNKNNPDTPIKIIQDNEEDLISLEYLNDGKLLLCKGLHRKMILCDTISWERITLPQEKLLWDAAISPSGDYLANVYSRRLELWDIRNPDEIVLTKTIKEIHHIKYHNSFKCTDFSPNGKWLAIGYENGDIRIWDLEQEKFINTLSAPPDSHLHLRDIEYSLNGRWIVALVPNSLTLWDVEKKTRTILLENTRIGFIRNVKVSPDGKYIGIRTHGKSYGYIIWSLPEVQIYHSVAEGNISGLAFSPDGKTVAVSDPGKVILMSLDTLTPHTVLKGEGFLGGASDMTFSPDGSMLAGSSGFDGVVRVWDVSEINEK